MRFHAHLLHTANALLYLGPLLAGLGGFGWGVMPPFVLLFLIWLVVLRPQQWPQGRDWRSARGWFAAGTIVASQILLVAVLLGIGRGIGGVTGNLPLLNPLFPVALSGLSVPLVRLFWNPQEAVASGLTIDGMLAAEAALVAAPATDPLITLLAAEGAAVDVRLAETLASGRAPATLWALAEVLAGAPAAEYHALRLALIRAVSPQGPAGAAPVPALRAAFAAAGADEDLLRILLPRVMAFARAMPGRADLLPPSHVIEDMALRVAAPDLAMELRRLASLSWPAPARTAASPRPATAFAPGGAAVQGA